MEAYRILIVFSLFLTAMSCENESYDSGTGEYSLMTGDLVEAYTNGEGYIESFITDDGIEYTLTEQISASWASKPDSSYRALLYYNLVDDGSGITHYTDGWAEAVSISEIPVLSIITLDSLTETATDPVDLESIWMGKNGNYLNLSMYLKIGESDSSLAYHTIGMVRDSAVINADKTITLCLTFYHDQGEMPEYYSQKYYMSIRSSDLIPYTFRPSVKADSVRITINTYDGEVVKTIESNAL